VWKSEKVERSGIVKAALCGRRMKVRLLRRGDGKLSLPQTGPAYEGGLNPGPRPQSK
jgi:hypothetical protein